MSAVLEGSEKDESFASLGRRDSYGRDCQLRFVLDPIGPSLRRKTKGIDADKIFLREQASPEFEAMKEPPERNPAICGQPRSERHDSPFRARIEAPDMDVELILAARLS
jgi:hypothetical protein